MRTVICAILRRYGLTVVTDFAAAIETAAAAGHEDGTEGQYAATVVDLDLLACMEAPTSSCDKDKVIQQLRAALWGEGAGGIIVGIAPAAHATAAQAQVAQSCMGIDAVLQR